MTTKSTTYKAKAASQSFGPIPNLINSVRCTVYGGAGENPPNVAGGLGGRVDGTITMSVTDTLTIYAAISSFFSSGNQLGGRGYHAGGNGGNNAYWEYSKGFGGGGSSAVLKAGTVMLEAGGGGGTAGGPVSNGGAVSAYGGAGYGGAGATAGADGATSGWLVGGGGGKAPTLTADGAGGTSVISGHTGSAGSAGVGGAGASADTSVTLADSAGGGGGGGYKGGGGGGAGGYVGISDVAPGGGGAGGLSYAASTVGNPQFFDGTSTGGSVTVTYTYADVPLAPTLLLPASGGYLNLAGSVTFNFQPNHGTGASPDSGTINAFAMRVKLAGGTYGYWNGTNFTSTSVVWNAIAPGVNGVSVAGATIGANGNSYQWSVATRESHYNLIGPFAPDNSFTATVAPVVTVVSQGTSVYTATPSFGWTTTYAAGESQLTYRGVVYLLSQTLASGFDPSTGTPVFDTGTVTSTATNFVITTALLNTQQYVVYVMVTQTPGGVSSDWASNLFQVAFDGPAVPTLGANPSTDLYTDCPITNLSATSSENLLSAVNSSFETGLGDWVGSGATLVVSGAYAEDQKYVMKCTSTSTGTATAQLNTGHYVPVVAGSTYTFMASVMSPGTAIYQTLAVIWYNAAGTVLSSAQLTTYTTQPTWYSLVGTAVAPANAAFVNIQVTLGTGGGLTSGRVFLVDEVGAFLGNTVGNAWSMGGYNGAVIMQIQYSDNQLDSTLGWSDVRHGDIGSALQPGTLVVDYESPFNQPRFYRARSVGTTLGQQVYSDWSPIVSTTLTSDRYWFVDPLDPSIDASGNWVGSIPIYRTSSRSGSTASGVRLSHEIQQLEQQGQFQTFGRSSTVLVRGDLYDENFELATWFGSLSDWENFDQLRLRRATLCMRADLPGKVHYMALGGARPRDIYSGVSRNKPDSMSEVILQCIPQDKP